MKGKITSCIQFSIKLSKSGCLMESKAPLMSTFAKYKGEEGEYCFLKFFNFE